jgi:hypothetical protein
MGRRLRCVAMILLVSGLLLGSTSPPWGSPETQATRVHIVLWGEILGLIAQRYGVTSARMCAGISWRQQTSQNFAPRVLLQRVSGPCPVPVQALALGGEVRAHMRSTLSVRRALTVDTACRVNFASAQRCVTVRPQRPRSRIITSHGMDEGATQSPQA